MSTHISGYGRTTEEKIFYKLDDIHHELERQNELLEAMLEAPGVEGR